MSTKNELKEGTPAPSGNILSQNDLLRTIAGRWPEIKADLEAGLDLAAQAFLQTSRYQQQVYNENTIHHDLARIQLRHSLEELCRKETGWKNKVQFDPLLSGKVVRPYLFQRRYEQLIISSLRRVETQGARDRKLVAMEVLHYTTFDQVLMVDGLPVVIELKLSTTRHRRGTVRKPVVHRSRGGLDDGLRKERVQYVLAPVQQYFTAQKGSPDCGYLLILYPEMIRRESKVQQEFRESGGLIVPWYADRAAYRQEVQQMVEKYKLLPKMS